jgi:polysaccharide export outer membrane protein
VAIYETDSSLFGPSMVSGALAVSPMTPLPPQTVDQTGEISVPFVGRVHALGRRTGDVENDIRESLKMKTSDPQVVVTMADRKGGNLISIAGDVRNPSLEWPIEIGIEPLVSAKDAIAATFATCEKYD